MNLKSYLATLPRGTQGEFAKAVGIDKVYLSQIASEKVRGRTVAPSPALAVRIEQATNGLVSRRELRPADWKDIWPELAAGEYSEQKQPPALDGQALIAITGGVV